MGSGWNNSKNTLEIDDAGLELLKTSAAPCDLQVSKNSFDYKISLRAPGGNFAFRKIHLYDRDLMSDPIFYIDKLIHSMKKEIGSSAYPAPPVQAAPPVETPYQRMTEDRKKREFTEVAQRKPVQKVECPEHHNFLVPAEEGVLQCPIPGCKRKMRKKAKEEVRENPDVAAGLAPAGAAVGVNITKEEVASKFVGDYVPDKLTSTAIPVKDISDFVNYVRSFNLSEEETKTVSLALAESFSTPSAPVESAQDPYNGKNPYGRLPVNDRPINIQCREGRWYLFQRTDNGSVVIDITKAYQQYDTFCDPDQSARYRLLLEWKVDG